MAKDNMQLQRLEFKYLVREEIAIAMRDYVRTYLVQDENCIDKPNYSYMNHSVYLDSPKLRCYWDVINGVKNRYKLRLRFYDDNPSSPIFFEIKRRMNSAILKQRGAVHRSAVPVLLSGQLPEARHLTSSNPKHLVALQRFHELMMINQATPKTHVAYLREAWVSEHDNSARVTFDREVFSAPQSSFIMNTHMDHTQSVRPWGNLVILELKFTGRFPAWFSEMVRQFQVVQCGVAKYAEGVAVLEEKGTLHPLIPTDTQKPQKKRFMQDRVDLRNAVESAPFGTPSLPTDRRPQAMVEALSD